MNFFQKATAALAIACVFSLPAAAEISTFSIDKDHSSIEFSVKHLAINSVKGIFSDYDGNITWDSTGKTSSIEGTVRTDSVDTRNKKRDSHLKSAEFFDSQTYPEMKFKSKNIKKTAKGYVMTGDFTLKNTTKTVQVPLQVSKIVKDPWGNERASFTTSFQINRKDYGVNYHSVVDNGGLVVGDIVTITLDVEGIKKK